MIDQSKIRNFCIIAHTDPWQVNTCGPYHRDDGTSYREGNAGPGSG